MANEVKKKVTIEVDDKSVKNAIKDVGNLESALDDLHITIKDINGNTAKMATKNLTYILDNVTKGTKISMKELTQNMEKVKASILSKTGDVSKETAIYNKLATIKQMNAFEELASSRRPSFFEDYFETGKLPTYRSFKDISNTYSRGARADIDKIKKVMSTNQSEINRLEGLQKKGVVLSDKEVGYLNQLKKANAGNAQEISKISASAGKIALSMTVVDGIVKAVKQMAQYFTDITGITLDIKKNFKDIMNEASNLFKKALTANQATSLFSDSIARSRQLTYGLSASQSYAMAQAMSLLGMSSEEDLLFMNQNQARVFNEFMSKYGSWYSKMESSGLLQQVQEMQLDLKVFKQEVAMELLQWFAKNKDSIMTSVRGWLQISKALLQVLIKIGEFFGIATTGGALLAATGTDSIVSSDTVATAASVASGPKITNVTLNMNNSAELANSDSDLRSFFNDQGDELIRQLSLQLGDN